MEKNLVRRRWIYIVIFFCFLFLQQFDGLVVESIRYKVEEIFSSSGMISENLAFLLFLFVGLSYLLWGISYDRHSRRNLLVLAGAIWWATSWLSSLAPTAETFVMSYLTGLMDFGSMTGIYSLVGDYFSPRNRGKIFGLLQSAQPIAYFLVLLYFQDLFVQVSWRSYLLVSGVLGLTLALVIYLFVREPKRGLREPALIGIRISGQYLFDWEIARDMIGKPSFIFLCGMSLFSIMPWMGFSLWTSALSDASQSLIDLSAYPIFFPIIVSLILGNALGGFLGDFLFQKKKRGRVITKFSVLFLALITSISAFLIGNTDDFIFRVMVSLTALFLGMGRPIIFAMLFDITLPEIRATATSMLFISQMVGLGLSWALISAMQKSFDAWIILFSVTLTSILVNLLLSAGLFKRMPVEVENLRRHMAYRSQLEARLEARNK